MKRLFTIGDEFHGTGPVLFSWQPDGNFLATAGQNGKALPHSSYTSTPPLPCCVFLCS